VTETGAPSLVENLTDSELPTFVCCKDETTPENRVPSFTEIPEPKELKDLRLRLLPRRLSPLMDMILPNLSRPRALNVLPTLAKPLTEIELPMEDESQIEVLPVSLVPHLTESMLPRNKRSNRVKELPSNVELLIESELPKVAHSTTETSLSCEDFPKTDKLLPNRNMPLTERPLVNVT